MSTSGNAAGTDRDEPGSDPAADSEQPPEPEPSSPTEGTTRTVIPLEQTPGVCGAIDVSVATMPGVGHDVDQHWLSSRLADALPEIRHAVRRVSVIIVDDRRMVELHSRYMGVNETTDVLTFPGSTTGAPIDVDIAVCADEAARQVAARRHSLDHELLLYALHGVLHCAGYDDKSPPSFEAMHAEEDRILRAIGEHATFAPGVSEDGGGAHP